MAWIALVAAGLFEVAWASLLGRSDGLTRPWPTGGFLAALALSMWLLAVATRTIPIGTAYALWVGIGAVGTFAVAVLATGQRTSPAQVAAVVALVASIVAVKVTAPD